MISEDLIWDTIIRIHNSLGHVGQHATGTHVNREFYGIASQEVYFLVKLCEICHRKAHSKSKGPLKSIVTTRLFERVQIDLIDMTSTPDGLYVWICHMEDHFSKFHMLFAMTNKEAATVARHIHTWIVILGIFEILQSDNGSEFKGICLELMRRYGIKVINGRPRTPRTQGLIEQANGVVKNRITTWKREHGSTAWADALEEITLQLNSTYHKAIKAIPYEVVFNRKPNYKRAPIGLRQITEEDVENQEIDDEVDDSLIYERRDQTTMEERVELQLVAPETANDPEYQEAVTYRIIDDSNRIIADEEAARAREEHRSNTIDPSTPPNRRPEDGLPVDPDLLSPQLDRLRLAQQDVEERDELASTFTTSLRQQVQINQRHANERSKRQYGKQRQTTTFELGDQVSVAVPALDRASTDDKRLFGRVIGVHKDYDSYQIVTKYGILDRNYPISELNPLPSHIDIEIPNPPPTAKVTLHYCAAQESTTEKVPVHCNCRDQKTWCSTRRCACIKAEAKCSVACHGGSNQDNMPDCPNISSITMRTQRGHRTRNRDNEAQEAKRQRRNRAGQWIASKGRDLIGNRGSNRRGSQEGSI